MTGPYNFEADAARDADRVLTGDDIGTSLYRHLVDTCGRAGVQLGAFDRSILAWLARWEPATVQVFAALIQRAHDAGAAGRKETS